MSLKCLLGLAVCLAYDGSALPKENVSTILSLCDQASRIPAGAFISTHDNPTGNEIARDLQKQGLSISLSKDGTLQGHRLAVLRKKQVLSACNKLKSTAANQKNWTE